MKSAADTLEGRIRERAYHIWEASGRPLGRDEEFWQRACQQIGIDDEPPDAAPQARKPKRAQAAQTPRKRSRKAPA
jgi:Protein of unknown function (DUF2934)